MNAAPHAAANSIVVIERLGYALAVAAVAVAGLVWGPDGTVAAAVGAALAASNLFLIRRLVGRALVQAAAGDGEAAGRRLLMVFVLKMPLLFLMTWAAIAVFKLDSTPFAVGLSALVLALVAGGLFVGLDQAAKEAR
jgi:hypothetical protein